ncbi:MAG: FtsK/SpoIIIE domain-containing protein [Verrucomicrobiota bacterium]
MNKETDLRVSRTLELLAQLRQTGAAFAQREDRLTRDLATRRLAFQRAHREADTDAEAQAAAKIAAAEARFRARTGHVTAVYETRHERIQTFAEATLGNLPTRARQAKESWMGALQMRDFEAQTRRTAALNAASASYNAQAKELALQRGTLATLEKKARRACFGYASWLRGTAVPPSTEDLPARLAAVETALAALRALPFPRFLRLAPLRAAVTALAEALASARQAAEDAAASLRAGFDTQCQEIERTYEQTHAELAAQWDRSDSIEAEFEEKTQAKLEKQLPRALARNEAIYRQKTSRITAERAAHLEALQHAHDAHRAELASALAAEADAYADDEQRGWADLQIAWEAEIRPLCTQMDALQAAAGAAAPAWSPALAEAWTPPTAYPFATPFARIAADLSEPPGSLPKDPRLALPCASEISLPLALAFPAEGSLLFETAESGGASVMATINQIILRLLATTPPGKISFTLLDPVGLGENFAGFMQLADYEESLINRRIWTQRDQIEERLAELCEHLEKVIQMYLRNQYATISEYNAQAGSVAEKYHFLVVADFPAGFSETAAARLQSIATSGARCGVFTLLHWDKRQPLPDGFSPDELRAGSIVLRQENGRFWLKNQPASDTARILFDAPPAPELALALTQKIGKSSIDSNRVEVPFSQIAPPPEALWTNDTTNELRVAIGRTGATKQQYLAIGKGTRQHALFAGKTGSGKSTLFHVIITNLALSCSPQQVEFYLIDFKKGVEFKCYAEKKLPHARVIAIESDREFALSVLERVDAELKRRGDLFRDLGVQDISGYKRAGGKEPIPRTLLIIDEFQEFFVEDDAIAQTASLLFDRIVRQGRAFGIHVLLGSQTLGGAYSLARATLGQMVIRVALQCNEADAYLIMDESNPAPRLLSRPGEGIYNDAAGALEGNNPFQVVWLPDDERDCYLDKVQELAARHPGAYGDPIVFEGNAPAALDDNALFSALLAQKPTNLPAFGRAWLGAPNSIKGPTEATFQRQSGSNLLLVGQRDEVALTLLGASLLALAAQYPAGCARFFFLHAAAPGTPEADFLARLFQALPHPVTEVRPGDLASAMAALAGELQARAAGGNGDEPPLFCCIHGLHKFKKLRHEDDFAFSMSDAESAPDPGAQFTELLTEGASHGIHLLASFDTLNNVNRFLNRKALSEFEMRVVFQMSANDSASLIDSPQAGTLGLHRALFYNEHEGTLETFRPYATPTAEWLRQTGEKLAGRS